MAVIIFSGLPGTGKTASSTYLAIKEFKKDNNIINRFLYYKKYYNLSFKEAIKIKNLDLMSRIWINKIYSNYPILLQKKRNIYSKIIKPDDLLMKYQFEKGSVLIFDEMQRYFDSREFKKFPKDIGTFVQHHRHADIKYIIFNTQHPRRLDNKLRDLAEIFRKYRLWIKIPFLPLVFQTFTNYYEFEDYGLYHKVEKEYKTYDYDNHFRLIYTGKLYNSYNDKYFNVIFKELPMIDDQEFTGKDLTVEEIKGIGIK